MLRWALIAILIMTLLIIAGVLFWMQTEASFHRDALAVGTDISAE